MPAPRPAALRHREDAGITLVEVLVAMTLIVAVMAAFFLIFLSFSRSATSTRQYTQQQQASLGVLRVMQADVRSANPLVLVPSSFTLDPNGTAPGQVVALDEVNDRFSPCRPAAPVPNPAPVTPFTVSTTSIVANLVWAYDPGPRLSGGPADPNAGTLIRYSYCPGDTPVWQRSLVLGNVVGNTGTTIFTVSQDVSGGLPQATIPPATTIANQSVPVCANSLRIVVQARASAQAPVFTFATAVPLENQTDFSFLATTQGATVGASC